VSSEWVQNSSHGPSTPYDYVSYGYQWWIDDYDERYSARGYDGQFIFVIQEHDIVVVFSSDVQGYFDYDGTVSDVVGAITNIYPESVDPPPTFPYLLVGGVAIGVIAIAVVLVRKRK
jgi:CubicO group peptidase (beta-lactamase class C family)